MRKEIFVAVAIAILCVGAIVFGWVMLKKIDPNSAFFFPAAWSLIVAGGILLLLQTIKWLWMLIDEYARKKKNGFLRTVGEKLYSASLKYGRRRKVAGALTFLMGIVGTGGFIGSVWAGFCWGIVAPDWLLFGSLALLVCSFAVRKWLWI